MAKTELPYKLSSIVKTSLEDKVFNSLDFLRKKLANILTEFSPKDIASITGYGFILEALSEVGI